MKRWLIIIMTVLATSAGTFALVGWGQSSRGGAAANTRNALLGIHSGLGANAPANYQGVAIYCEWETSEDEWVYFREHFSRGRE